MLPIKIPELCKPDIATLHGYTGGLALYLAHWESVQCLYQPTNVAKLAYITISLTYLN